MFTGITLIHHKGAFPLNNSQRNFLIPLKSGQFLRRTSTTSAKFFAQRTNSQTM